MHCTFSLPETHPSKHRFLASAQEGKSALLPEPPAGFLGMLFVGAKIALLLRSEAGAPINEVSHWDTSQSLTLQTLEECLSAQVVLLTNMLG